MWKKVGGSYVWCCENNGTDKEDVEAIFEENRLNRPRLQPNVE